MHLATVVSTPRSDRLPKGRVMKSLRIAAPAALIAAACCTMPAATSAVPSATAAPVGVTTATSASVPAERARVDVDGDGRRDQVRITRSQNALVVRVVTARGATASAAIDQGDFRPEERPTKSLHGAVAFDGVPGRELFVYYGHGAHTPVFQVLTWRRGRLVAMPDPSGAPLAPMWAPDAAFGYGTGYRLTVRGSRRDLAVTRATRTDDHRYVGMTLSYRWRANAWRKISAKRVSLMNDQAERAFGWHVRGLPAWPSPW